jgi:PKD domain
MAPKTSLGCACLLLAQVAVAHAQVAAPQAQDLVIDHKAVGCIVVGKYPKMNACFTPAPNLARGRVYFRPEGTPSWYYVEMKTDQPCYTGILPKPGKKLVGKKIEYYVEGQARTFNAARTAEYGLVVVRSARECKKDVPVAPFANNATVAVFPSMPAGFAAGGAIGTAAALGIAGAGIAAGTAVAVASGGNDNTTTTTTPGSGNSTTTTVAAATTTTTSTTTTTVASTNHPPLALLKTTPDPPQGIGPLTVTFDLCSSTDPDGDPLSFFFDFGDGATTSGGCVQSHAYPASTSRGVVAAGNVHAQDTTYNFQGSVVDTHGASQSRARNVVIHPPACGAPDVAITAPKESDCFGSKLVFFSANASGANKVHFAVDEISCTSPFPTTIPDEASADVVGTSSPYSTTIDVGLPTFECYRVRATAFSACSSATAGAAPMKFIVDTSCGCKCGPKPFGGDVVRWSSDLAVDGGRLQLVMNGSHASFAERGRADGAASLVEGENRVEAVLVEAAGKPGLWRFDLVNSEAVVPGSLRVVAGEVVSIASSSLTFRLRGVAGERIVFTFQKN